jgi:hypothetical protein
MTRKFTILFLSAAFLAASGRALTTDHAAAAVNYNSSRAHSGENLTAPKPGNSNKQPSTKNKSGIISNPNEHR